MNNLLNKYQKILNEYETRLEYARKDNKFKYILIIFLLYLIPTTAIVIIIIGSYLVGFNQWHGKQ